MISTRKSTYWEGMCEKYMLLLSGENNILQKDIEYHILAIVKGILVLKQYIPTEMHIELNPAILYCTSLMMHENPGNPDIIGC